MSYKKQAFKKNKMRINALTAPKRKELKYIVSPRMYERFLELEKPNLSKEEMMEKCLIVLTAAKNYY